MKSNKNIVEESKNELLDAIKNSRLVKGAKITIIIVAGIYAFGLGCKIINFSTRHFLTLKNTIKQ